MTTSTGMTPQDEAMQKHIEALMAQDDFAGLGQVVQQLYKMPQAMCKMRGNCCRIVTFKGLKTYPEIQALAQSQEGDAQNAQDFLTLFEPYANPKEVQHLAPVFVERVLAQTDRPLENVGLFKCKFVGQNGACQIHEDRPTGCRVYPFPHQQTIYHPGCGFEQAGQVRASQIEEILAFLNRRFDELTNTSQHLAAKLDHIQPQAD